jgi:hypothetical protein
MMKISFKYFKTMSLTAILWWAVCSVYAQKETEIFIPVGKSPGVSGKTSIMGRVEKVNLADSTITLNQDAGSKIIKVTMDTKVYLDRSKLKLTNTKGSCTDIKPGMMIEAKYLDNKSGGPIEWVKVQLE